MNRKYEPETVMRFLTDPYSKEHIKKIPLYIVSCLVFSSVITAVMCIAIYWVSYLLLTEDFSWIFTVILYHLPGIVAGLLIKFMLAYADRKLFGTEPEEAAEAEEENGRGVNLILNTVRYVVCGLFLMYFFCVQFYLFAVTDTLIMPAAAVTIFSFWFARFLTVVSKRKHPKRCLRLKNVLSSCFWMMIIMSWTPFIIIAV